MEAQGRLLKTIKKRNGSEVNFNPRKITEAILKAGSVTGEFDEETAKLLTIKVILLAQQVLDKDVPSVEEIQDIVEEVLLSSPYKKTAKAYIIYRDQRARAREIASMFNVDMVDNYLEKSDWQVKENSNMSFSLQGLNNYISSEVSKVYWLNKIYPAEIREAHTGGDIHIHDLGLLSVYCVGWDLTDLLREGFKGAVGKVESRPAKHFRSALGQVVNFFYTLQGEAAGAQAFSDFDTLLAPFIRYDNLSYEDVKQSLQEFMFNLNVPTRVGFQTPFTNVTMDVVCPRFLAGQNVIIGGEVMNEKYGDFQKEMDIFNKAFLEVMRDGDAKGRVFTFPIPTYNITKDFNWDNDTVNFLWEITAKYGIPYFANFVNSDMNPDDARSMCCRLRIDNRELKKRGGGLFGSSPLTGSIGVVTINMPRIGFSAGSEKEFFNILDEKMELAKKSLEIKRKVLNKYTDENLYPYVKYYLRHIKERFGEYWKNHFSTIGIVGMNEACLNFLGEDCHIGTCKGKSFAEKVLSHMRERLLEFQAETGNNYNLEATPAEGTSFRLAKIDKDKRPAIRCANEKDWRERKAAPFYTNSSQLPVDYTDDMFEVLDKQDSLQTLYTGGTVQHLFIGEKIDDFVAVKELVRYICGCYELPYFSITPTFSVCPECGYLNGEVFECPECGRRCEVYSRVVGYLRPVNQWNDGKREEYKMRSVLNPEKSVKKYKAGCNSLM